jgi:glycosyltransferase involved in cell wall biosynthesis
MFKEISVVLPAYNEEDNIKKAILDIDSFLKKYFRTYEIIIVNNGSHDKTQEIVSSLIKKNKKIKLVRLKTNNGYGSGLRSGFAKAKYQYIFYTDADNQFDIRELSAFKPLIGKYDIICGYRRNRQDPRMRILTANVYNTIINILFRLNVRDIDCSFKLYRKEVFDAISLKSNTGLIDAEILIKAKKSGFTFAPQLPVTHYPRTLGSSSYNMGAQGDLGLVKPNVVVDIFQEIHKLWRELR